MSLSSFKSLDLYPKLSDDVRVKTFAGAAVSIVAACSILILFVSELLYYLTPARVDRLEVDVSRGEQLPISLDVTFPRIPCQLLSLQAMDVAGSDQEALHHTFTKTDVSAAGVLGTHYDYTLGKDIVLFGSSSSVEAHTPAACGSCYGAARSAHDCCGTCDDVRRRYTEQNKPGFVEENVEQCIAEKARALPAALATGAGCRVRGTINVNKVAGNIYLVPGRPALASSVLSASALDATQLDVRHTIHSLQFGQAYEGIANPLDGVSKPAAAADAAAAGAGAAIATDAGGYGVKGAKGKGNKGSGNGGKEQGMYMYYVKVIPTTYSSAGGEPMKTNQYSVTEHTKQLTLRADATTQKSGPGLYIFYELSPIMVKATQTRPPLLHFVTQLCAIIGGVFTVAGMVDRFIYAGMRHMQGRVQLGAKVN